VLATATSGAPSVLYVIGQSWHGRGSFQTKARLLVVSGWKRRSNQPALSQIDAFHDTVPTRMAATHRPSVSSSSGPMWIGIEPGSGLETSILTRLREMQVQAQGPLLCGMGSCGDTRRSKSRGQGQGRRCGEVFSSLRASTASGAPVFVLALPLLP